MNATDDNRRRYRPGTDHVESWFVRANDPAGPRAVWLKKTVLAKAGGFGLSADGKRLLALQEEGPMIGDAKAEAKFEKVPTQGMRVEIDPRAEWRQIFVDAWRMYRDFFYDPAMHRVDWPAVRARYAAIPAARTRRFVSSRTGVQFVIDRTRR